MTLKHHRLGVFSLLYIYSIFKLEITPTESTIQIPVEAITAPVGKEQCLNSSIYIYFFLCTKNHPKQGSYPAIPD